MSVRSVADYSGLPTFNQTLEQVLTNGNDAGNQSIIGLNDISLNTINGSAYPPPAPATPNLSQVLTAGSVATTGQSLTGLNNVGCSTLNGSTYPPPAPATPNLSQVLTAGSVATTGQSLTGLNNVGCSTLNGSAYPPAPATPNITAVLGIGNDANNLGILNTGPLTGLTTINGITYIPNPTLTVLTSPQTFPINTNKDGTNFPIYNATIPAGTYFINVNVQFTCNGAGKMRGAFVSVQTSTTNDYTAKYEFFNNSQTDQFVSISNALLVSDGLYPLLITIGGGVYDNAFDTFAQTPFISILKVA
nr:MAG: hypothetical protein [Lake Baikal virophage 8]